MRLTEKKREISNTEWGLVIGALFVIDLIQIGLDLALQLGVILNRFIDIFVGLALGLYLQLSGQSLANPKRLLGLIATFVGEEIPDVDAIPFWTIDGFYNMSLANANKILDQVPGGGQIKSALDKVDEVTEKITR